jgi:hypothetical protein
MSGFTHKFGAPLVDAGSVLNAAFAAANNFAVYPNQVASPQPLTLGGSTTLILSTAGQAGTVQLPALDSSNGSQWNGKVVSIRLKTAGNNLTVSNLDQSTSLTLAAAGDFVTVVAIWDAVVGSGSWEIVDCGKVSAGNYQPVEFA